MRIKGNTYIMALWRIGLVMVLFSLQRLLFFLFNRHFFEDVSVSHLATLMRSGLQFDLTATLYTNALFLLMMIIPFPFKYGKRYQQVAKWIFFLTNGLIFAANIIDFVYFRYTLRRTDFGFFTEFATDDNLFSIFFIGIAQYWYLLLLFIGGMFFLWFLYGKVKQTAHYLYSSWRYYAVSVVLMAAFAACTVAGIRGGFAYSIRPITLSNAAEKVNKPIEIAIVLNTPFSIFLTTSASTLPRLDYFDEAELATLYTPIHSPDSAVFNKKNVVIIILESFAKEYSGYLNHYQMEGKPYQGFTPFFDSIAQNSLCWEYSFANGQKSIDAIPSVLGGIPSLVQPFVISKYALNNLSGLGSILKEEGYQTAFFHGAINGSMGFSSITNSLGFEKYYGKDEYNNDSDYDGIWGIWDEEFLQFYAGRMSEMRQPFLTSVFTTTSHHPYNVPERYKDLFPPEGGMPIYRCLRYTDHALKQFFETASQQEWYHNTLFVITADHSLPSTLYPVYNSYTNAFSVPILFYSPADSTLAERRNGIVQQIDILPTVLGYLGYDKPYFAFGTNQLGSTPPFAANYLNGVYQWIEGQYLVRFSNGSVQEIFDFVNDPMLTSNMAGSIPPDQQTTLEKRAKAFIQQYHNRMIDDQLTVQNNQ